MSSFAHNLGSVTQRIINLAAKGLNVSLVTRVSGTLYLTSGNAADRTFRPDDLGSSIDFDDLDIEHFVVPAEGAAAEGTGSDSDTIPTTASDDATSGSDTSPEMRETESAYGTGAGASNTHGFETTHSVRETESASGTDAGVSPPTARNTSPDPTMPPPCALPGHAQRLINAAPPKAIANMLGVPLYQYLGTPPCSTPGIAQLWGTQSDALANIKFGSRKMATVAPFRWGHKLVYRTKAQLMQEWAEGQHSEIAFEDRAYLDHPSPTGVDRSPPCRDIEMANLFASGIRLGLRPPKGPRVRDFQGRKIFYESNELLMHDWVMGGFPTVPWEDRILRAPTPKPVSRPSRGASARNPSLAPPPQKQTRADPETTISEHEAALMISTLRAADAPLPPPRRSSRNPHPVPPAPRATPLVPTETAPSSTLGYPSYPTPLPAPGMPLSAALGFPSYPTPWRDPGPRTPSPVAPSSETPIASSSSSSRKGKGKKRDAEEMEAEWLPEAETPPQTRKRTKVAPQERPADKPVVTEEEHSLE
ncbi:hypothetical protein B0H10DRAFT_2206568 [Mycena sp. CBHHK59/15]|nr:hypothetical protein B0H10DRAFT_2206568 [Mycena sp. CBHHK59/15]